MDDLLKILRTNALESPENIGRMLGVPAAETWSGAGHDAQHLAGLVPSLLLFVPLHGGESHTPQEGAEMREILQATAVAARVLGRVALDTGRGV